MREKGKGVRERRKGHFPSGTKDCLGTKEADVALRQMAVYKRKGENPIGLVG